jgi:PKD repeat protein
MKRKPILLALLVLLTLKIVALPISKETASKAALNLYFEKGSQLTPLKQCDVTITGYQSLNYNGQICIHVFEMNKGKGFVMVSAESNVMPVLGYSFEGGFVTENLPENVQDWINGYLVQIEQVRSESINATDEITEQWQHYTSAEFAPVKSAMNVIPLLTTDWDQGCFYNSLCPTDFGGVCNHVWVGCVATAMGMVMKYHNYPEQGTGSHTYNHSAYGIQTADFGATTYDWNSMPNTLNNQNTAVATLLYHCGVSVNMNYGTGGSGAYTQDVRDALVNYFSYGSSAQYVQRMWYSSGGWENLLISELDSHQPVVYSGQDPNFGHAFVCDGYQGTNYFHFNWGWSGWNNGYFYVSNLNSGNGNFTNNQAAVVHIAPAPVGPLPSFTVNMTQFCAETTVQFHDNTTGSPISWNWEFPGGTPSTSTLQNPFVTYSAAGNFNVILTVTDGTNTNTITKNNYIIVKEKPYGLFPSDSSICFNNTISLNAGNPGSSYIWSTGESTQTILVDSSGNNTGQKLVTVEILTMEGCWNKDSILVSFAPCTGMQENDYAAIQVFPNPVQGTLRITAPGLNIPIVNLLIYNEQGMLVKEENKGVISSEWQLDISDLQAGLYVLVLETSEFALHKKLIIK